MGKLVNRIETWRKFAPLAHYQVRELAALCKLSMRTLQRQFRRALACSPQKWLDDQRCQVARELLQRGATVKETSVDLGFKHPSHFSRHFKERAQMTPSQFAARSRRNATSKTDPIDYSI